MEKANKVLMGSYLRVSFIPSEIYVPKMVFSVYPLEKFVLLIFHVGGSMDLASKRREKISPHGFFFVFRCN
jgi:hypothetical protein